MNNPNDYFMHSGAAEGSDTQWGLIGIDFGIPEVNIKHWLYKDYVNAGAVDKEIIDEHVKRACMALGRPFQPNASYYPLLGRNYFQVVNSDAVFAIGRILSPGEKGARGFENKSGKPVVDGGTGYACEMAIQMGKPVYVFDLTSDMWRYWNEHNNTFDVLIIKDIILPHIPKLTKRFAGIGTREITAEGVSAIVDVYTNTFKQ